MTSRRVLITVVVAGVLLGPAWRAAAQDPSPTASPTVEPTASPESTVSPIPTETPAIGPTDEGACFDFATQEDAQLFFEAEGGPAQDPHSLDEDHDGTACEILLAVEVGVLSAQDIERDRDCEEFSSQADAQAFFTSRNYSSSNDPHELDDNDNNIACDEAGINFTGSATSTTASPGPTAASGSPTPAATVTPRPSALPKSGGPIQSMGLAGISLTLGGLVLLYVGRRRRRVARLQEDYELISW